MLSVFLITSRISINAVSMTTCQMQPSDYKNMRERLPEYLFNLFDLVISFKIPGIKYILEQICQKWKCESIQSASRRLKLCLTLFISFHGMHAHMFIFKFINTCFDTTLTNNRGKPS